VIVQPSSSKVSDRPLLLMVAFLLVNAPNYHLSLVLASVVQGDAVNCNIIPLAQSILMLNWKRPSHNTRI